MKLTENSKNYIQGITIVKVTDTAIILSDGTAIYLSDEEIETINFDTELKD